MSPGNLIGNIDTFRPTSNLLDQNLHFTKIHQAILLLIKVLEANFGLVHCFNNVKDPGLFFISFMLSLACYFFIAAGFCLMVAR